MVFSGKILISHQSNCLHFSLSALYGSSGHTSTINITPTRSMPSQVILCTVWTYCRFSFLSCTHASSKASRRAASEKVSPFSTCQAMSQYQPSIYPVFCLRLSRILFPLLKITCTSGMLMFLSFIFKFLLSIQLMLKYNFSKYCSMVWTSILKVFSMKSDFFISKIPYVVDTFFQRK